MGDAGKTAMKLLFAGFTYGAVISYTVDYSLYQNNQQAGFIILILLIWIFGIVGIVAAVIENMIVAIVFFLCFTLVFLVERFYIEKTYYSFIWGSLAACTGVMFAVMSAGGGK